MRNSSRSGRDIYEFIWQVSLGGYGWVTRDVAVADPEIARLMGRVLTDGRPLNASAPVNRYSPLNHSTLYRDFAAVEPSETGILTFARRFGSLLGTETELFLPVKESRGGVAAAEELLLWQNEISAMREVLEIHELLGRKATTELRKRIHWSHHSRVTCTSPSDGRHAVVADSTIHPELLNDKKLRFPDVLKPAQEHIRRVVSRRLGTMTSTQLLWDAGLTAMQLYVMPKHLLGALWLQCGRALESNQAYRKCSTKQCPNWFPIGLGIARADKKCCSDACKMRLSRQRTARLAGRGGPKAAKT
jgi:hypothetical protein